MNTLILPTTQKGCFSTYFWTAVWMIAFFVLSRWCAGIIDTEYSRLGVGSFEEFSRSHKRYSSFLHGNPFFYAGQVIGYCVAGLLALRIVWTFIYGSRESNVLTADSEGYWNAVCSVTYGFPFSRDRRDLSFHQVMQVTVSESSIDRLVGTGSIQIRVVTYTSGDTQESTWTIPGIADPYGAKALVDVGVRDHEGLMIQLSGLIKGSSKVDGV